MKIVGTETMKLQFDWKNRRMFWGAVLIGLVAGIGAGIGGFTFVYARGASYLTDDPAACANCHIMNEQYDAWTRSSHHSAAICNDCHTPKNFTDKYLTKASNGYHHSMAFTTGWFHEPIQITDGNLKITEAACRNCHGDIVRQIDAPHGNQSPLSCIRCHNSVGHLHWNFMNR